MAASHPKPRGILVACCEPIRQLGDVEIGSEKSLKEKARRKLSRILTEGIVDGLLPIPRFVGHVPSMAANLKRLELLNWGNVEVEGANGHRTTGRVRFVRVASTDSPFRELVVWAYLRVAGRPGAPDFDVDEWLGAISESAYRGGPR